MGVVVVRVLLVEDDEVIGQSLCDLFQAEGYTVDWKTHGKKGAEAIQQGGYDIALLDSNIPHFSGLELLALIREKAPDVPAIILTAQDNYEVRCEYLSAGANEYITKPFNLEKLFETMESLVLAE